MGNRLDFNNVTTDPISLASHNEISTHVLRIDKLNPVISGNKWFKLRFYIDEARAAGKKGILTFGGAWSNHIVATAAICRDSGLSSIGIIRGEEPANPSPTLIQAREMGMHLFFTIRIDYTKRGIPPSITAEDYLIVEEGGYGRTGANGASTIFEYVKGDYTHYCCAVGTGTMMAGLINGAMSSQVVTGISVMKNNMDLENSVQRLVSNNVRWEILHDYHFGGYAKKTNTLLDFMNAFFRDHQVPLDFVYTGKLFYAVANLIRANYFPPGSRLLLIHSGGLQGNRSLLPGTLIFQ